MKELPSPTLPLTSLLDFRLPLLGRRALPPAGVHRHSQIVAFSDASHAGRRRRPRAAPDRFYPPRETTHPLRKPQ